MISWVIICFLVLLFIHERTLTITAINNNTLMHHILHNAKLCTFVINHLEDSSQIYSIIKKIHWIISFFLIYIQLSYLHIIYNLYDSIKKKETIDVKKKPPVNNFFHLTQLCLNELEITDLEKNNTKNLKKKEQDIY